MKPDEDIAALLPEPPPPVPSRREAAIGAALRRFDDPDATEDASLRKMPAPEKRPWFHRPQLGLAVSAALVALIGLPMAWVSIPRDAGPKDHAPTLAYTPGAATPAPSPNVQAAPETMSPPAGLRPQTNTPRMPPPAEIAPPPGTVAHADTSPLPPPAAVAPSPPAMVAQTDRSEQYANAEPLAVQSRAPEMGRLARDEDDASSIIVTGARRQRVRPVTRGDWNACTVNDPSRSLRGCRSLINPGRRGAAGQAAAQVAEGLTEAWQGNADRAIAVFDRAIEIDPRGSIALLNRGLLYGNQGELDRAIADIDLAIKYAPGEARGYYNRSLLLRQRGDARRAKLDEKRAVELDADYVDVIR